MSLARIKTWVAAEVLYALDLNNEFNNVLNNALSLISPLTASLDVNGMDLTAIDELAFSDAAGVASAAGRLRRNAGALTWKDAAGDVHQIGTNWGLGTNTFGTSADNVFAHFAGTAPTTSPVDAVQWWAKDINGAGTTGAQMRAEQGDVYTYGASSAAGGRFSFVDATGVEAAMLSLSGAAYYGTISNHGFFLQSNSTSAVFVDVSQNVGIGAMSAFGTTASRCFALGSGTAPTTVPADMVTEWATDRSGAGSFTKWVRTEDSGFNERALAVLVQTTDTTERTTVSLTAVSLSSHTVNIPAGDAFIVTGQIRKTSGAAATVSLGLTINGSIIITPFAVTSATDRTEAGGFSFGIDSAVFGAARDTNYTQGSAFVARTGPASGLVGYTSAIYANQLPTAAITAIVITGLTGSASVTCAIKNITVYRVARA